MGQFHKVFVSNFVCRFPLEHFVCDMDVFTWIICPHRLVRAHQVLVKRQLYSLSPVILASKLIKIHLQIGSPCPRTDSLIGLEVELLRSHLRNIKVLSFWISVFKEVQVVLNIILDQFDFRHWGVLVVHLERLLVFLGVSAVFVLPSSLGPPKWFILGADGLSHGTCPTWGGVKWS